MLGRWSQAARGSEPDLEDEGTQGQGPSELGALLLHLFIFETTDPGQPVKLDSLQGRSKY